MTQPNPDEDLFSPRTMRIALGAIVVALIAAAWFLATGWVRVLLIAVAVVLACAAIMPPFKRPRP